jgi:hypothetical protein
MAQCTVLASHGRIAILSSKLAGIERHSGRDKLVDFRVG